jgi:hypothetical protein
MSFSDGLKNMRKQKYAVPFALALTVLLTLAITLYLYWLCFGFMLVAMIAYGIPFYFGLKNRKKLFVFGTILFLFLGLAFGMNYYFNIEGYKGDTVHSEKNELISGTVSPLKGLPGDTYSFSVELTNGDNLSDVHLLALNGQNTRTIDQHMNYSGPVASTNYSIYTLQLNNLTEGIYQFQYQANVSGSLVLTGIAVGPINMAMGSVMQSYLIYGLLYVGLFQIGILFYLLLLLTWWMDKSKKKMEDYDRARKQEKKGDDGAKVSDMFVCSECGADVPMDSKACPKCGEKFEEAVERECRFCKAKVLESDIKCWNCGKELPKQ